MERFVTNEELKKALSDQDNIKITDSLGRKYSNTLDHHTILSCKMMAVFRALKTHDYAICSFSQSVYRFMAWELSNATRRCIKHVGLNSDRVDPKVDGSIWDYTAYLPDLPRQIMELRFAGNCTFDEIAGQLNISKSSVYNIYNKSLKVLRKDLEKHEW